MVREQLVIRVRVRVKMVGYSKRIPHFNIVFVCFNTYKLTPLRFKGGYSMKIRYGMYDVRC